MNREKIIGKNFQGSVEFAAIRLSYGAFLMLVIQSLISIQPLFSSLLNPAAVLRHVFCFRLSATLVLTFVCGPERADVRGEVNVVGSSRSACRRLSVRSCPGRLCFLSTVPAFSERQFSDRVSEFPEVLSGVI